MKKIRMMDEMEMSINFRSIRLSWDFGILFLLIWTGVDWFQSGSFNRTAFILLLSQLIIYQFFLLFLKWKLGKDEK